MADAPFFIDDSGNVVQVKPGQEGDAVNMGWLPASPKQIQEHQLQEKYGTTGQAAIAGVESAASALTLGGSTYAERALGVPAEDIAGRERANPLASGLGTAVGIAAPAVLSGGSSLLADAADASAPSLIAKLGAGVGKGVEAALPEAQSTLGRMAVKALASGAQGAVEGAAYGAGNVVHESALGDPHLTAQSALAEIGLSAALGGGMGGLLGAAEVGVPAAVQRAKEAISNTLTKAGGLFEEYYPDVAEKLTGVDSKTVSELLANREELLRDPRERIKLSTDLADSLQEQHDAVESALRKANAELRPEENKHWISVQTTPKAAQNAYAQVVDDVSKLAQQMREKPELYPARFAKRLEDWSAGLVRDGSKVANQPAKAFEALNDFKQEVDKVIRFDKLPSEEAMESINALKGLRSSLRAGLEDESVWGVAGARQAAFNEAQSDYFSSLKEFRKRFMAKTGPSDYRVDPVKVNTYLNQMADARGQIRSEAMDNFGQSTKKLIDQIQASSDNAPTGAFDRKALDTLVDKTGDIAAQARKQATMTQLMNQLEPRMSWGSLPLSGAAGQGGLGAMGELGGAAMLGHFVPGLGPVAAVGAGLHSFYRAATNVPRAVATLATLERTLSSVSGKIDFAVGAIARGAQAAEPVVREGSNALAAFARRVKQVQELAGDANKLQGALTEQAEPLHEHAPETAQAMQMTSARAVAFLASKVPAQPKAGPIGPDWVTSPAEAAKFNRYYQAVHDPLSVLKHAQQGIMTPEELETLNAVYPQLLGKIRSSISERLMKHPKGIPYHGRVTLSLLMGSDLDGSMSPMSIAASQRVFAMPSQRNPMDQAGGPAGPRPTAAGAQKLTLSKRTVTPMDATAQRE